MGNKPRNGFGADIPGAKEFNAARDRFWDTQPVK